MSRKTKKVTVPTQQGEMPPYAANVNEKLTLGGLGLKYGLSAVDMTRASDYSVNIPGIINQAEAANTTAQALNNDKDEMLYEARGFYKDMGHAIQKHASYEVTDMEALGFFVIETPPDPNIAKPVISKTTILPDQVILDWVKGAWDGVYIESYVVSTAPGGGTPGSPSPGPGAGTPVWIKIAEDEKSPYEDTRTNVSSQPETRFFRMRYKKNNQPVGLYSDVVKVIVEIY
jgi:hypothetical protein